MLKEVCVENFSAIPKAIENGAGRIELCDNLAVGGTTVSFGVASKAIQYCQKRNIKVMAIVRPRGGNFIYTRDELDIMIEDIIQLKQLGVNGIVIGCLDHNNWIDESTVTQCLKVAKGLEVTFHMAFDKIPANEQPQAIDWLVANRVKRILTHGGPASTNIESNLETLKKHIHYASGRIIILPGGGITPKNLPFITKELGVEEVHGTKIVGE